ncbi:MAG: hypothetical protein QN131_06155 [Armatimonadota bacterium]|nr:hypothetical protein [Armatimonadota bacterium]MDR7549506.1 hypothetical protein [Armatimonadota bacterium]
MRASRRRHLHRAFLLASLLAAFSGCQQAPPAHGPALPLVRPVPDAPGRLLYARLRPDARSAFMTFEPATGALAELVVFPPGVIAGMPAASPDGAQVAYSAYRPGKDPTDPGGTDLYVMDAAGGRQHLVATHPQAGESLTEPAWAPDGRALYVTHVARDGAMRIERISLSDRRRQTVIANASYPTVAPDGRVGFIRMDPSLRIQELWVAQADGRGARRIVAGSPFAGMAFPRFAPAADLIVFAAIGGPVGSPSPRSERPVPLWQRGRAAFAHAVPWDLWIVASDGTGLRQVTNLKEDYPVPVWSADGHWIAFTGEFGLYLLRHAEKRVVRVHDEGAGSGLAWLSR